MNKLAIVICNYNKRDFIINCIKSVLQSDNTDFDIFVVDNASTDGSADAIREEFNDRLTLLTNEVNTGGSGGFNRGMQAVMDKGIYQYVILLDNDIIVNKNTVSELRSYIDKHPEVGVCGAAIFQMENPEITQEMGANISFEELTNKPLCRQARINELPPMVECDYVPIGASIIRTKVLKKIGLMESEYFIYWDDMEFCWRIRNAGYKIHAISSAIIYHNMSSSKYGTTYGKYYFLRNKINCFAKHTSGAEFALLPELITKRLYRSMVCSKDNVPLASTYMYALDDALNGVMGKVDNYKIFELPTDQKWYGLVRGKSNILIHFAPAFIEIENLLARLRELCNAKITILAQSSSLSNFRLGDAAAITEKSPGEHYDLEITVCYHVLDLPYMSLSFTEGSTLIYDNYGNTISDRDDLLVYQQHEDNYIVFRSMLYTFIKDKLGILRENYYSRLNNHDKISVE